LRSTCNFTLGPQFISGKAKNSALEHTLWLGGTPGPAISNLPAVAEIQDDHGELTQLRAEVIERLFAAGIDS